MAEFNLRKFLIDVFNPQAGERVLVMTDLPHGDMKDTEVWQERREMAREWHDEFVKLGEERGFEVLPFGTYEATGANGAPLPAVCKINNEDVGFEELLSGIDIVVAPIQFSATGPLAGFADKHRQLRGASMPGVTRSMEKTGFAADYKKIQARCKVLQDYMRKAEGVNILFSNGDRCYFDMRFREPFVDDGLIDPTIKGIGADAIRNLPGGEVFEVPYEGERGEPSKTAGRLPMEFGGSKMIVTVEGNRIVSIEGEGFFYEKWSKYINEDNGRKNIAEVGFGCNDMADPGGPVIESEKTGFHWAIGESDHLGGVWSEKSFDDPEKGCHWDFVYRGKNTVVVKEAKLIENDGTEVVVMRDGKYVV